LCYWKEKELDDILNDLDLPPDAKLDRFISFQIEDSQSGRTNARGFVKPAL
jgi:hypothetical protein